LKEGFDVSKPANWSDEELLKFSRALRKSTKPMIIAANKIDRPKGKENYEKIKEEFDYSIIPCFAEGELSLKQAEKAELIEYISGEKGFDEKEDLSDKQKEGLEEIKKTLAVYGSTGVQEILNKIVFDILGYIAVFPAGSKMEDSKGNVLPDCYLMPPGSTALDFAYRLHSDIGDGFVKAIDIRTKQAVGKDYKLKHLDGLEILTR